MALFAVGASLRWRQLLKLLAAALIIIATHFLALILGMHATLAVAFDAWSEQRYGLVAMNLLFYLWQGYEVVDGYAILLVVASLLFDPRVLRPNRETVVSQ